VVYQFSEEAPSKIYDLVGDDALLHSGLTLDNPLPPFLRGTSQLAILVGVFIALNYRISGFISAYKSVYSEV
jgi:hypothetical protein